MKSGIFFALAFGILILYVSPASANAALLFYDGFESGVIDWDDQSCMGVAGTNPSGKYTCHGGDNPPGAFRAIESNVPARAGQNYLRSTLGTDAPSASRTEVTPPSNARYAERNWNNSEYWIGISMYFPAGEYAFRNSGGGVPWDRDIVYQWHANLNSLTAQEFCGDCYPLIITTMPETGVGRKQNGNLIWRVETNYGDFNLPGVVEHDKWYDWVIHVKWSYDNTGIMEIWRDGVQVHSYSGKNMPHDTLGPYWKFGIYKAWWRDDIHPEDADEARRSIYHDEYRIGDANSSYTEVAPADGNPPPIGGGVAAGGTTCSTYLPNSTPPTGFGASYNLFTTARELLLSAICNTTNTVSLTSGNAANTTYIWNQAYYTRNGQTWNPITLSGTNTAGNGQWIIGTAQTTQPLTTSEQATQNYYASYVCTYQTNTWKCGCSDTTCATPKWNLQGMKK